MAPCTANHSRFIWEWQCCRHKWPVWFGLHVRWCDHCMHRRCKNCVTQARYRVTPPEPRRRPPFPEDGEAKHKKILAESGSDKPKDKKDTAKG
ncbi:hypothetical protein PG995_015035 [Apiospora arundinis]